MIQSYWSWLFNLLEEDYRNQGGDPGTSSYHAYAWASYKADLNKRAYQAAFARE